MQQPTSISTMNSELQIRCRASGLEFDCGCGGLFNAQIAIIAEAPGEREVQLKQPLIGNTGKLLFDCLRREGITRNAVYLTNVVKRKLVSQDQQYGKPKAPIGRGELEHWRAILLEELSLLPNVRYVVSLGNFSLSALTQNSGITQWRGSVLPVKLPNRVVTGLFTYNPAIVFREPKTEIVFRMDLGKLSRVVNGTFKPPVISSIINPTYSQAIDYIRHCENFTGPVAVDIETMANETACVGLASSNDEGVCIAFRNARSNVYSLPEERSIRLSLQRLLSSHTQIVAQNATFDSYWMGYKDRIRWRGAWFDTMLAHHLLYPPLPHNLGFLTAQYTDHPYYKDDGKTWRDDGDIDQFWRYNVTDCCITRQVALKQLDELRREGLDKFFFSHVMRLQPHLVRMTVNGIKCDQVVKANLNEIIGAKVEQYRREFLRLARIATSNEAFECNPNSWQQLSDLFFRQLKLVGRGGSTDEENRKRMVAHPRTSPVARQMIHALDEYKSQHKLLTTYVESNVDDDGRFRCEYSQIGVASAPGRLSSRQTMWGNGLNLQNIPDEMKVMFEADEGFEFTYFDAAQIEARIVGWKYNIVKWKEQFELARRLPGSYDAHCALAAEMFKVPYDDVPKFDRYPDDWPDESLRGRITIRFTAKRCLPPECEVLTPSGWTSIANAYEQPETQIACVDYTDPRRKIFWQTPSSWHKSDEDERLVLFDGEHVSVITSLDHRMPMINNGYLSERRAEEFLYKRYGGMPLNGEMHLGNDFAHARLLAMAWSDGSIEPAYPNSVRVSVAKERKAIRVRQLAHAAGLRLWESLSGGMYHFRVYGFHQKKLDWSMLHWSLKSRKEFLDELVHWDGCAKTGRIFNCDLEGLRIVQTLAHVSGLACRIREHGKPKGNERQCYMIRPKPRPNAYYSSMDVRDVVYSGPVYCPTVSSGMFLVRYKDSISATFNCRHGLNYRMGPPKLATTTGLSAREAHEAYTIYHRTTPEIMQGWDAVLDEARRTRRLYNAFGRMWILLERWDERALESVIAFYPQSTAGDHIGGTIYLIHDDPEWPKDARVILNIHDALVAMHRPVDREVVVRVMKRHGERPIIINGEELIVPVDFARSVPGPDGIHRWSTLKKIKPVVSTTELAA